MDSIGVRDLSDPRMWDRLVDRVIARLSDKFLDEVSARASTAVDKGFEASYEHIEETMMKAAATLLKELQSSLANLQSTANTIGSAAAAVDIAPSNLRDVKDEIETSMTRVANSAVRLLDEQISARTEELINLTNLGIRYRNNNEIAEELKRLEEGLNSLRRTLTSQSGITRTLYNDLQVVRKRRQPSVRISFGGWPELLRVSSKIGELTEVSEGLVSEIEKLLNGVTLIKRKIGVGVASGLADLSREHVDG